MWTPTLLRLGEGRVERGTRARRGWMEPSARRSGWRAKQSCASRARPMWGRRGSRCSPGRIRTARMEHCRRSARGGVARRHAGGAAGRHGGAAQGAEARRVRPSCSKVSAVGVAGEGSRRLPLPGGCRARGGARPSGGDRARGRLRAAPLLGGRRERVREACHHVGVCARGCDALSSSDKLPTLSSGRGAQSLPRHGRAGPGESYRQWRNSEVENS